MSVNEPAANGTTMRIAAVRPAGLRERGARDEGREPGEQQRAAVNHFSDLILDRLA